jgi:hypothetical protein
MGQRKDLESAHNDLLKEEVGHIIFGVATNYHCQQSKDHVQQRSKQNSKELVHDCLRPDTQCRIHTLHLRGRETTKRSTAKLSLSNLQVLEVSPVMTTGNFLTCFFRK